MKKISFLLLLSFSINTCTQNISGKVTYTISMEPFNEKELDSVIKKTSNNKKANNFLKELFKNADDVSANKQQQTNEVLQK
jgi:hypothetical protein